MATTTASGYGGHKARACFGRIAGMDKNWLFYTRTLESGEPGATALINLSCVRTVEIVSSNTLQLRYGPGPTETITVEGQFALDLVKHLMTRVIRFDQAA
jgi:hypothetical protein